MLALSQVQDTRDRATNRMESHYNASTFSSPKKNLDEPSSIHLIPYQNAPSPKNLPRSLSRSSSREEHLVDTTKLQYLSHLSSSSSYNGSVSDGDNNSETQYSAIPSTTEGKKIVITKSPDWQWEYSSDRIGIYSITARRERIDRYRQKRRQLSFRHVRYFARSNICQKRERVGGRFVKTDRVIRADTKALMHPEAVMKSQMKKQATEAVDLKSVAEMMVGLSKGLIGSS